MNWKYCVYLTLLLLHLSLAADSVSSWAVGFENLNSVPPYEYGASIILEGDTYYQFYCSPGSGNAQEAWDYIRITSSSDGNNWSPPSVVLAPNNKYDRNSVCDPSVVKFNGIYHLYHTCINTIDPPDGYKNNRICVALSKSITGPYQIIPKPVVEDLTCTSDPNAAYCVGQPSAVVYNDTVYLYYTDAQPGESGRNGGYVYLSTSRDGINFTLVAGKNNPIYTQRNVDVKYSRKDKKFILIQGDVGDSVLTWSTSPDGIHFEPYDRNRNIHTNPSLVTGGDNNNPGMAGLPDGSIGCGYSFVTYGSSYSTTWGAWHLYRSDFVLNPEENDCSGCAQNSCDFACSETLRKPAYGICKYPGSKNVGMCCECYPL